MTERPIIFSGESVRSILSGRKTQTRRLVKLREFQPSQTKGYDFTFRDRQMRWHDVSTERMLAKHAQHRVGDRLWVKETFLQSGQSYLAEWGEQEWTWTGGRIEYVADGATPRYVDGGPIWMMKRPAIHMPRSASRITLEVLSVRAERLQEITEEDALLEGVDPNRFRGTDDCWDPLNNRGREYRTAFEYAWGEIHGWDGQARAKPGVTWSSNPWVWVVSFRMVGR